VQAKLEQSCSVCRVSDLFDEEDEEVQASQRFSSSFISFHGRRMSLLSNLAAAEYGRAAPTGARGSGAAGQRQSAPTTRDEGISATFRAPGCLLAARSAPPPIPPSPCTST